MTIFICYLCVRSIRISLIGRNAESLFPTASPSRKICSTKADCGTDLGPLVSGFIAQNTDWRWVFYVQAIDGALIILAVVFFFKETRGSVLLSKKAKLINEWYEARERLGLYCFEIPSEDSERAQPQRIRFKVKADEERETIGKMIGISCYRPFREHIIFVS